MVYVSNSVYFYMLKIWLKYSFNMLKILRIKNMINMSKIWVKYGLCVKLVLIRLNIEW